MKAGAIEFLTKPFSDGDLIRAIEAGIATDRKAREEHARRSEIQCRYDSLTLRERQVFPFVALGSAEQTNRRRSGYR